MPLAVLEALACGLPVVGTDLPVQRQLLEGLPGTAIVPPEPAAISAAIRGLATLDEAARDAHRRLARARIEDEFALDAWARRLVDLYEQSLLPR